MDMSIQPMGLDQVGGFELHFVPPLSVSPNLISTLEKKIRNRYRLVELTKTHSINEALDAVSLRNLGGGEGGTASLL